MIELIGTVYNPKTEEYDDVTIQIENGSQNGDDPRNTLEFVIDRKKYYFPASVLLHAIAEEID